MREVVLFENENGDGNGLKSLLYGLYGRFFEKNEKKLGKCLVE